MHTIQEKSKMPHVLMYTDQQMLLSDVPVLTLLMQQLD